MRLRTLVIVLVVSIALLICGAVHNQLCWSAEKKQVKIAGGRVGDPWYVFAQALSYFINKRSDWLRSEVVATPGITGNSELIRTRPKEYIGLTCFSNVVQWRHGIFAKTRGPYYGLRFIASANSMTQTIVTYDPKIKSVRDLAGKKVHVGRKGATNTPDHEAILKEWGVLDKVTLVHGGYGGGKAKLRDGLVDATFMIFDHIYPANFKKGAFITELETKKPVYFLDLDREKLLKLRKEGFATLPVRVPAGALDPKTQPNEIWAYNDVVFFGADEQMDEDIVYEVTRIICETAGQWTKWHPQGAHMTMDFIPAMFLLEPAWVHPGAKKYYDEHHVQLKDLAELLR